jgi:hypothetical protein
VTSTFAKNARVLKVAEVWTRKGRARGRARKARRERAKARRRRRVPTPSMRHWVRPLADPLDLVLQPLARPPFADDGGDLPRPVGLPPDDLAPHTQLCLLPELVSRQPRTHRLVLQGVPPVV